MTKVCKDAESPGVLLSKLYFCSASLVRQKTLSLDGRSLCLGVVGWGGALLLNFSECLHRQKAFKSYFDIINDS